MVTPGYVGILILTREITPLTVLIFLAKRRRIVNCGKILLDVTMECSGLFPPLKAALGAVSALVKHYEVLPESATVAHNSPNPSQQYEDVKEKVEDLIPQLDRFKQHIDTTTVGKDPEETNRRRELIRCVCRLMATRPPLTAIVTARSNKLKNPRNR